MSQSFYKLYYHIIWGTKNREHLIIPEIEKLLKWYIPKRIFEQESVLMAIGMVEEHLHLLASISPKTSIADFVNKIKGSSSHYINTTIEEKSFYWQAGYGILSLSEKNIPFVKEYIENQKIKHASMDLVDILEYVPEENNFRNPVAQA